MNMSIISVISLTYCREYGWREEYRLHDAPFFRIGNCLILTKWCDCNAALHGILCHLNDIVIFGISCVVARFIKREHTIKCANWKMQTICSNLFRVLFANGYGLHMRIICFVCMQIVVTYSNRTDSYSSKYSDIAWSTLRKSVMPTSFVTFPIKYSRCIVTFRCKSCTRSNSAGASSERKIYKTNKGIF